METHALARALLHRFAAGIAFGAGAAEFAEQQ
jgi:hypothetical protein